MTWTVATYLVYLALSLPLTVWVATELSRHGRVFLADALDDPDLGRAVDRLLVVGFYLVNVGFISLFLRIDGVVDLRGMIEQLSVKLGVVMLVVGLVHAVNVWVFASVRRRHRLDQRRGQLPPAPAAPGSWVPAYPAPRR